MKKVPTGPQINRINVTILDIYAILVEKVISYWQAKVVLCEPPLLVVAYSSFFQLALTLAP